MACGTVDSSTRPWIEVLAGRPQAGGSASAAIVSWCVSAAVHAAAILVSAIWVSGRHAVPVLPGNTMLVSVNLMASWAPAEPEPVAIPTPPETPIEQTEVQEPPATVPRQSPAELPPTAARVREAIEISRAEPRAPPPPRVSNSVHPKVDAPDPTPPRSLPKKQSPAFLASLGSTAAPEALGDDRSLPDPIDNLPPTYPPQAVARGWAGKVVLRALVSAGGAIEALSVAASSGFELLDQSAAAAVRLWRFRPATEAGQPVAATILIPVVFELSNSTARASQ